MWRGNFQAGEDTSEQCGIETTSFNEIVQVLMDHLDPVPSAIMQRFKFNSRIRTARKSVSNT